MKSLKNNNLKGQTYEAPQMEIMVIEPQGVLCASGDSTTSTTSTTGARVQVRI